MLTSDFGEVTDFFVFLGLSREHIHFVAYGFWYSCFFGGLSRRICSSHGLWALFFGFFETLEECDPVMFFGLLSFAHAGMLNFTYKGSMEELHVLGSG